MRGSKRAVSLWSPCLWVVCRLGPYVVQEDTPLGQVWLEQRKGQSEEARKEEAKELFDLTTRMYALARVMLGDVNIAATTALQVRRPHPCLQSAVMRDTGSWDMTYASGRC